MITISEGRDGKCEERNEKCEFLARESVNSSPFVRTFGKGKCKLIANFSATMVTSLPSVSVSLSLSLSLSPKVPHAQYRKRFRASYNITGRTQWARAGYPFPEVNLPEFSLVLDSSLSASSIIKSKANEASL